MMKRMVVVLGMISLVMLMIAGCTGERGVKGDPGTAECMQCHSDNSVIVAIDGQWQHSLHASGANIDRNYSPCVRCHTGNGFMAYVSTGALDTIPEPAAITCFACHRPHENRNFDLRTMTPVSLENGGTFDFGAGNLCANCHMGRLLSPGFPASPQDTIRITSSRWGPHHALQADMLSGNNAYEFPGATYSNSRHTTVVTDGCPECHMATPEGYVAGGHSMNLTFEAEGDVEELLTGCMKTGCHFGQSNFDFNYKGLQDSVATKLAELQTLLIADSLLNPSNDLFKSPRTVTGIQLGAYYNYKYFQEDRSLGVHNSQYALDALNASIAALSD